MILSLEFRVSNEEREETRIKRRVFMKSLKKLSLRVVVPMVLLLAIAFYGMPAFGQAKYVLKFNHVLGQKEPYHKGFTNW